MAELQRKAYSDRKQVVTQEKRSVAIATRELGRELETAFGFMLLACSGQGNAGDALRAVLGTQILCTCVVTKLHLQPPSLLYYHISDIESQA